MPAPPLYRRVGAGARPALRERANEVSHFAVRHLSEFAVELSDAKNSSGASGKTTSSA